MTMIKQGRQKAEAVEEGVYKFYDRELGNMLRRFKSEEALLRVLKQHALVDEEEGRQACIHLWVRRREGSWCAKCEEPRYGKR